tara:strand:+ start:90 stop:266 length:177 start_codon:yes stop_codon:yes gene_type:complete
MNKKNRTFIWGLILIYLGGYSIDNIIENELECWYHYVFLGASIFVVLSGLGKIKKVTH